MRRWRAETPSSSKVAMPSAVIPRARSTDTGKRDDRRVSVLCLAMVPSRTMVPASGLEATMRGQTGTTDLPSSRLHECQSVVPRPKTSAKVLPEHPAASLLRHLTSLMRRCKAQLCRRATSTNSGAATMAASRVARMRVYKLPTLHSRRPCSRPDQCITRRATTLTSLASALYG